MSNGEFPLFRDYSLAVRDWLRESIKLTRLERVKGNIQKITRHGTANGGVNQHEIHLDVTTHKFKEGQAVKIEGSERNDNYYMVKSVHENIVILDPVYKRLRTEQATPGGTIKRTINVVYGNMDRAVSQVAQPLRNGTIDNPGIAFYISDFQHKVESSRPKENYYTRKYVDNDGNFIGSAAVPPLLEYQVTYSVNIWAVYAQEMDIMNYQIITEFNPDKFFWIGEDEYGFGYEGDRMDRQHHGQWAHALMEGISDVSDLEPGGTNRSLRTEIGFVFTNAFLPQPFDDESSFIGAIDVETVTEERDQRC